MELPANADIPFLLSRIRPDAAWGWRGGAVNEMANLDWRDGVQAEPIEAEYAAEQVLVDAEGSTGANVRQQIKTAYAPLAGRPVSALTNAELRTLAEVFAFILGGVDFQTRNLKTAAEWKAALDTIGL